MAILAARLMVDRLMFRLIARLMVDRLMARLMNIFTVRWINTWIERDGGLIDGRIDSWKEKYIKGKIDR